MKHYVRKKFGGKKEHFSDKHFDTSFAQIDQNV